MDGETFAQGIDVGTILTAFVVADMVLSEIQFDDVDLAAIMGAPTEVRMQITAQLLEAFDTLRRVSRELEGRLVQLTGRLP